MAGGEVVGPRPVDAALAAWHDGRLWVLESGTGRLVLVDPPPAAGETRGRAARLRPRPGAVAGRYAFVGLSKIRTTSAMDGVPLAERRDELKCGVAVVDLRAGRVVALLEFQTAVEEIFDVQLLPGPALPRGGRLPEGGGPPHVRRPGRSRLRTAIARVNSQIMSRSGHCRVCFRYASAEARKAGIA